MVMSFVYNLYLHLRIASCLVLGTYSGRRTRGRGHIGCLSRDLRRVRIGPVNYTFLVVPVDCKTVV